MQRLVVATGNPGKLAESAKCWPTPASSWCRSASWACRTSTRPALPSSRMRSLKARQAARLSGLPALADDSGLIVDALAGAPGPDQRALRRRAARRRRATSTSCCANSMACRRSKRGARFHSVIVVLRDADRSDAADRRGHLARPHPRRRRAATAASATTRCSTIPTHGLSAAEMGPTLKNRLSHRGQALHALRERLRSDERCARAASAASYAASARPLSALARASSS